MRRPIRVGRREIEEGLLDLAEERSTTYREELLRELRELQEMWEPEYSYFDLVGLEEFVCDDLEYAEPFSAGEEYSDPYDNFYDDRWGWD